MRTHGYYTETAIRRRRATRGRVRRYLRSVIAADAEDVAEALGISVDMARVHLTILRERGSVFTIDRRRPQLYAIAPEDDA